MGRKGILSRGTSRSKDMEMTAIMLRFPLVTRLCWAIGTDRQAVRTDAERHSCP